MRGLRLVSKLALRIIIPCFYIFAIIPIYATKGEIGFGNSWVGLLGLCVTIAGLVLWVLGYIHIGWQFGIFAGSEKLVTNGVYSICRHPIYTGIMMTFAGLTVGYGSWAGLIYVSLVLLPLNFIRARREDRALADKFGKKYLEYRERTLF